MYNVSYMNPNLNPLTIRHIGQAIQTARKESGRSQKDVAEKVGVSRSTLDHIEKFDGKLDVGLLKVMAAAREVGLHLAIYRDSPQLMERRLERVRVHARTAHARESHLRLATLLAFGDGEALRRLKKARRMVDLWRVNKTCSQRYIDGWSEIVCAPPKEAARRIATIDKAWRDAMFQNTPFHSSEELNAANFQ